MDRTMSRREINDLLLTISRMAGSDRERILPIIMENEADALLDANKGTWQVNMSTLSQRTLIALKEFVDRCPGNQGDPDEFEWTEANKMQLLADMDTLKGVERDHCLRIAMPNGPNLIGDVQNYSFDLCTLNVATLNKLRNYVASLVPETVDK